MCLALGRMGGRRAGPDGPPRPRWARSGNSFDYQILHPVAWRRLADPKGFAHTDEGRIGFPFLRVVFVDDVLLVIAIEQVDHIAFADRKAKVGMEPTGLGNL